MITAYLRPDGAEMIEIDTAVYVAKPAAVRLGLAPRLAGTAPAPRRARREPAPGAAVAPGHTDLTISPAAAVVAFAASPSPVVAAFAANPSPVVVVDPPAALAKTARILLSLGASIGEAAATSGLTVDQVRAVERAMRGR